MDISITYVPINKTACIFTGLFFSALVSLLYILIYKIYNEEIIRRRTGFLLLSLMFFIAFQFTLSIILVSQNVGSMLTNVLQLTQVWLLPIVMALGIVFGNFIVENFGNITFSLVFATILVFFYNNYISSMTYDLIITLIIIITIVLICILKWLLNLKNDQLFFLALCLFISTVTVEVFFAFFNFNFKIFIYIVGELIFTSVLYLFFYRFIFSKATESENLYDGNIGKDNEKMSFRNYVNSFYPILSVIILIALPMLSMFLFTIGNHVGHTLEDAHLLSYEDIALDQNNVVIGKVISADSTLMYISNPDRTLKVIKLPLTKVEWESSSGGN